jgi:hypothetical protein
VEQFQGAVVQEQGVTFGIVVVQRHVLDSPTDAAGAQRFGRRAFGPMPIVLMGQDSNGVPTYYGRPDIVRFLASVRMERIPWKDYTLN